MTNILNQIFQCTGLFVIIVTGFGYLGLESTSSLEGFFDESATNPGAYALAFYAAIWAYGGETFFLCSNFILKLPFQIDYLCHPSTA